MSEEGTLLNAERYAEALGFLAQQDWLQAEAALRDAIQGQSPVRHTPKARTEPAPWRRKPA